MGIGCKSIGAMFTPFEQLAHSLAQIGEAIFQRAYWLATGHIGCLIKHPEYQRSENRKRTPEGDYCIDTA